VHSHPPTWHSHTHLAGARLTLDARTDERSSGDTDTEGAEAVATANSLLSERSMAQLDDDAAAAAAAAAVSSSATTDTAASASASASSSTGRALPVYVAFGWRTLLLDGHPLHSRLQPGGGLVAGGGAAGVVGGGGGGDSGGISISGGWRTVQSFVRRGRLAAAEHPMRAYRTRLLRLCRTVLPAVFSQ
jgi:hypothetical protein